MRAMTRTATAVPTAGTGSPRAGGPSPTWGVRIGPRSRSPGTCRCSPRNGTWRSGPSSISRRSRDSSTSPRRRPACRRPNDPGSRSASIVPRTSPIPSGLAPAGAWGARSTSTSCRAGRACGASHRRLGRRSRHDRRPRHAQRPPRAGRRRRETRRALSPRRPRARVAAPGGEPGRGRLGYGTSRDRGPFARPGDHDTLGSLILNRGDRHHQAREVDER